MPIVVLGIGLEFAIICLEGPSWFKAGMRMSASTHSLIPYTIRYNLNKVDNFTTYAIRGINLRSLVSLLE